MPFQKAANRLDQLENEIWSSIRRFSSVKVLLAVHKAIKDSEGSNSAVSQVFTLDEGGFQPFIAAGISSFAIRFSNPNRHTNREFTLSDLTDLYNLVLDYLTADPITTNEEIDKEFHESNPVFMMLRMVASQFPFQINTFGFAAQSLLLFSELSNSLENKKGIPRFEFSGEFQKLTGLSVLDFVSCGFIIWSGSCSKNNIGLTRGYFEKGRSHGIELPDDERILHMLNSITADPDQFRKTYEQRKQKDRRFRIYDFNPLLNFPLLRPWHHNQWKTMERDRIVAPLPDLIAYKISTGIYYEMFNHYKEEFSRYFGHLFGAYIGRLLEASVKSQNLMSEDTIRQTYPESSGKAPDWIVLDGSTAILIECKATRFSLTALETGAEESVNDSLKQILKGLEQLYEFRQAIITKAPGLERLHHCTELKPVIVTFEKLYLINTDLFRDHINCLLHKTENITGLPWRILSVKELECLQPHLGAGISLSETFSAMEVKTYDQVLNDLLTRTGLTYKDSMLYRFDQEMYERLKISDRILR